MAIEELRWSIELDAACIRELFTPFSDGTAAEAMEASDAVTALGGAVTERYVKPLIVLARADR